MYSKFQTLDEKLLCEAESILEEMGLDVVTAMRMALKKIVNDRSISFLLSEVPVRQPMGTKDNFKTQAENRGLSMEADVKMTKSRAINLLRSEGAFLNGNITFASKNRGVDNYWANPDFSVLNNQWNLILNDWIGKELFLFVIPAKEISPYSLVARGDKENQIDLQIMYGDSSFTDNRSKLSFARFLKKRIQY